MARRRRKGEQRKYNQLPTCTVCEVALGKDAEKHVALCESFQMFREALHGIFKEAVQPLPVNMRDALINGFNAYQTLPDLLQALQKLKDSREVRDNPGTLKHFKQLLVATLHFQVASEYGSFEQLQEELFERYANLGGHHKRQAIADFESTSDVKTLEWILRDDVQHLHGNRHPDEPWACLLLAEVLRFRAANQHDPPPAAEASAVHHEPLTQVAS